MPSSIAQPDKLDFESLTYNHSSNHLAAAFYHSTLVGRTHRSNQVTAPEYVFLISELAGEQRFASIVAKRLESLVSLKIT